MRHNKNRQLSHIKFAAAGLAAAAVLAFASTSFAQITTAQYSQYYFGTGTDIWWAQTNGNPTAESNPGSGSNPTGQSVDGLWNDNLSTGNPSGSQPAGTYPTDNWSTVVGGNPMSNPFLNNPSQIPGSPGNSNQDIVFDAADGFNTPTDVRINYSPTIQGLYIDNYDGATSITADNTANDSTPRTMTLGRDGITVTSYADTPATLPTSTAEANAITIGLTSVAPNTYAPLSMSLSASQTWADYTHSTTFGGSTTLTSDMLGMTVQGPISVAPGTTGFTTLTITTGGNNTYAENNHINGNITDGPNGALAMVFNSGLWTFGPGSNNAVPVGVSSFSGGIVVQPGAEVRDTYPTGAGTGTVIVQNGGSFIPSYFDNSGTPNAGSAGVSVVANPFFISGTGVTGSGATGADNFTVGTLSAMNTNGSTVANESVTLTGGVTVSGTASWIEGISAPLLINTNPLNLGSNPNTVVTLVGGYTSSTSAAKVPDTVEIDSPIQGAGGLTLNSTVQDLGTPSTQFYGQVVLAGVNTYTGNTIVNNGIVQIGNGGTNGSFGATNGTTTGTITFNYPTAGKSFGFLAFDLSSNYTVNNPITFNGPTTIVQGGTFATPSIGAGELSTLATAGTTVLNSVKAFSGTTSQTISAIVNAGTLELNAYPYGTNSPLPGAGLSITLNGGAFSAGPNFLNNVPGGSLTPITSFVLANMNTSATGSLALAANSSETLDFSPFQALGLGAIGNVTYTGNFTPSNSADWFGGGGGTLNFQPSNGLSGSGPINQYQAGTTILGSSGSPITFNGSTNVTVGNLVFNAYDSNLANSTGSITVAAGSAVAAGSGWLSGYLAINPSNTTPISSSFLGLVATYSQGALALTGDTSENLDFSSADPYGGFNALSLGAIGTVNYNGTLTPYNTTYNLGGGGGQLNFNSTLIDVGSATKLVVTGSGTVVLANSANSYSGGTMIQNGAVLQVNADTDLGFVPSFAATNITLNGATLQASGGFTLNSNRNIVIGAPSSAGSGTIDVMPGATLSYGGMISDNTGGSQMLIVTDSGTLALSGPNSYSGGTTIQNGATLQIDPGTNSLGTGGVTLNNGTLRLTSSTALPTANSISVVNPLNVSGQTSTIYLGGTSSASVSGPVSVMNSTLIVNGSTAGYALNFGGAVTIGGGTAGLEVLNSGNVTLGPLVASGAPQISFTGSGSVTLGSAAVQMPAETQVAVGSGITLNSNNATAMGIFSLVTINGGTLSTGASQTLSSLSGTGTVNLNGNTLTLGNLDAATGSFSGNITDGTGSNSALVVASGSTTLSGSSSYTGGTTVSGGTLTIANTASPATPIGSGTLRMAGGNLALAGGSGTSQTYANNVAVSANASIGVTNALTAKFGDLTIGSQTLTVSSTDTSSNPYSLTFSGTTGTTTLNGSPTFIVNKSSSGGAGALSLGSLKDGGTPRTLNFGGAGTTTLAAGATSLVSGTQVNLLNATSGVVATNTSSVAVNPISDYTFSAGSGSSVTDSGTLGYNGQFIGTGIGYSPAAKIGPYALNLTSASSYIEIPSLGGGQELISTSTTPTSYTVSAWVNASSLANADGTIFSTRNGGGHSFDLDINSTGVITNVGNGSTWITPNNGNQGLVLSKSMSTNTWYLVTATVTGTAATLYVNDGTATSGGATATVSYTGSPLLETNTEFATIGNQFNGLSAMPSNTQFLGQIDDVRLYNTALTAAEVAQLYDNITPAGATLDSNNATALGTTAQVTAEPNSTLSVGASQQIQTLAGSGTVALGTNTLTVGTGTSDNSTSTFSGAFTGAGGLTVAKSATGSLTIAGPNTFAGAVSVNSGNLIVISNSTLNGALNVGNGGNFAVNGSTNTVNVNGTLSLASGSSVNVTTGTLAVSVSGGSTISSGTNGVTVATGGTFQIAGSTSALSDSTTPTVAASVNNSGTFTVTGTNQVVNNVAGSLSTDANGATIYSGNTTVGTGSAANLTATQILQNSLTVGNGATVTIVPSSTGGMVATSAAVASSSSASSMSIDSSVADDSTGASAITAIESAVDSGQIGSDVGQALENSVARIDVLSTRDPQLNTAAMLSHVLDELAADTQSSGPIGAEPVSFSGGFTPPADSVGGPSSGVSLSGSPAAVPEPSTLVLSVLAGLVAAAALRRRAVMVSE